MRIDSYGRSVYSTNEILELMLKGYDQKIIGSLNIEEEFELKKYESNISNLDLPSIICDLGEDSLETYFDKRSKTWLLDNLLDIDPYEYLMDKCKEQREIDRVNYEYKYFQKYDLINILRVLIYFKNYMDEYDYICGVGRGSSVSLYSLYLIGIHKVDSIKYNLDIKEFFK